MTATPLLKSGLLTDPPMSEALMRANRWVATLAHELRDPLSAIMISLEELRALCAANPEAQSILEVAGDGTTHMARVIEDVLELCRIDRGRSHLKTESADLARIIANAVRIAQPLVKSRGHRLSICLWHPRPFVRVHPSRFQQILTNLLINAAKFTSPGGEIHLTAEHNANLLTIRVRDNGDGMCEDELSKIFDPYWRQATQRINYGGGLGIGLPLVKSLVELHGGTVRALSEGPGMGSEFIVRIPECGIDGLPRSDTKLLGMGLSKEVPDFL